MILLASNAPRRLLYLNYLQRVSPEELAHAATELKALVDALPSGFRVLADLSQVEYMDPECATELGRAMDVLNERGVSLILRVIPDPTKDIGLNILTIFHYPRQPRIITCDTLAQALEQLGLWS